METEPSKIQFENGSDHAVVASYSELYEEGEVEISTVPPTLPIFTKCIKGGMLLVTTGEESDHAV